MVNANKIYKNIRSRNLNNYLNNIIRLQDKFYNHPTEFIYLFNEGEWQA